MPQDRSRRRNGRGRENVRAESAQSPRAVPARPPAGYGRGAGREDDNWPRGVWVDAILSRDASQERPLFAAGCVRRILDNSLRLSRPWLAPFRLLFSSLTPLALFSSHLPPLPSPSPSPLPIRLLLCPSRPVSIASPAVLLIALSFLLDFLS